MVRSLAAVLLLVSSHAYAQEARQITISALNVRTGPGTGYPIVGLTKKGQKYAVLSTSGSWRRIWWAGNSAWIYGGFTSLATGTGVQVAASYLSIRSGPSTSHSVVGWAGAGQIYLQVAAFGEWRQIWFGGAARWCQGADTLPVNFSGPSIVPSAPSEWKPFYVGLTLSGSAIPRAGLGNGTLKSTLGLSVEPYGSQVLYEGYAFVTGKVSWFGGPNDSGTAGETVALTGESAYGLNNPINPSSSYLAAHPEKYYYAAMRWNYWPNGSGWWANQRILVVNPATGKAVVVRPVDWGPNTYTGRILDLSPRAIQNLGLMTDQKALVAFVSATTPLGVK